MYSCRYTLAYLRRSPREVPGRLSPRALKSPGKSQGLYIPVYTEIYYEYTSIYQYIPVYTSIYQYILYRLVYTALYCVQTGIYQYIPVYTQIYFYVQDFVEHIAMQ